MLKFLSKLTPGFLQKKAKGVGIEITPNQINIAKVNSTEQGYELATLATKDVPEGIYTEGRIFDPPSLAELIKEALEENNITSQSVSTAIPMRDSIVNIIPVPAELEEDELRDVVLNQEAGLYLPYPKEEVDLDYQKLGYFADEDGIEKVQVLLIATRREVTDLYLDIFQEQVGLNINALEINTIALIRTIREQLRQYPSQEAVILVDIEFDSTELAIIVDGVPEFNRTIPIGSFQLQSALSRAMNLPPSRNLEPLQEMTLPLPSDAKEQTTPFNPGMEALQRVLGELTDEVRRSADYYLNQTEGLEIVQIFLAGSGAGIGQLDSFFYQRLNIPATQIDPVEALSLETDEEISVAQRVSLGTVLGLALREA
ncbi:type IV pilus assembly protein PilM [Euhalothece natronophila Z-M001]|uniref:Type IV pilus assembly protein PilM n=1 Tax=Euhalothece natronophila Z-M001 TaxID=522448 RepID=A0A5B8NK41_9CHRO|nr:type IV pilus assembly protein PilM [Euhalothece natronophila]QDZ38891.1 type IV pilus assembly protein PilM [Euhalothece natronophila Z-M001]